MQGNPKDECKLNIDNISKYGFALFHDQSDAIQKGEAWKRDLEINVGSEEVNRRMTFSIPKHLLIELSPSEKIIHSDNFTISSISNSLDTIKLLSGRAGWNQSVEDLESMLMRSEKATFIATYHHLGQKISLGSGVSMPVNNRISWIGMILVHPELRRQGIASAIMDACLNHARLEQDASVVGLDATPLGKQVYDSLGFRDSFSIWRSIISTSYPKVSKTGNIETDPDFIQIKKYLASLNYTERISIIELLHKLPGSENLVAISADKIRGIVMSRPGRIKPFVGPLIADNKETAIELLTTILNKWKEKGYSQLFMDIPVFHLKNSIFSSEEKPDHNANQQIFVTPSRELIRMYQVIENEDKVKGLKGDVSVKSRSAWQRAIASNDETLAFMQKEKHDILPFMYGTGGPEWS